MWQRILKKVLVGDQPDKKSWTIAIELDDDGLEITLQESTNQNTYKISWEELLKQLHSAPATLEIPEGQVEGLGALFG